MVTCSNFDTYKGVGRRGLGGRWQEGGWEKTQTAKLFVQLAETATICLDHNTSRVDIGSRLAPHSKPQWFLRLCYDSSWLDRVGKKPSICKSRPSYVVTVSR